MDTERPKCDRCEKPATMMVRDMLRHESGASMFVEWTPLPGVRYGCDDHPVQSEEHLTHLPPTRTS